MGTRAHTLALRNVDFKQEEFCGSEAGGGPIQKKTSRRVSLGNSLMDYAKKSPHGPDGIGEST